MKQFKDLNIGAIFNLQQTGEHALCADGIDESTGFSYRPEDFMNNRISYFNYSWKDHNLTSYKHMF